MTKTRGRPKQRDIASLIVEGINSQSRFQCKVCKRCFPRMKNLNTHYTTHSDEKKYKCDFPDCMKSFKQSSQLKNHLLLHSKEKPFMCPAEGCLARYTHSSRICPSHSSLKLIKQPETNQEIRKKFYRDVENLSESDKWWFENYLSKRERRPNTVSVKKRKIDPEVFKKLNDIMNMGVELWWRSRGDGSINSEVSESDDTVCTKNSDSTSREESIITDMSDVDVFNKDSVESIINNTHVGDNLLFNKDSVNSIIEMNALDNVVLTEESKESIKSTLTEISNIDEDMFDYSLENNITKRVDNDNALCTISNDSEEGVVSNMSESDVVFNTVSDIVEACQDDVLLFWSFLNDLYKKGGNSRALFKKRCNAVLTTKRKS